MMLKSKIQIIRLNEKMILNSGFNKAKITKSIRVGGIISFTKDVFYYEELILNSVIL